MIGISEILTIELKKTICALSQVDLKKPEKIEEKITEAVNTCESNLEMIKDINSNAQMLLQIFSTSLQISSMELGKLKLNNSSFNILKMVDSIVSVFSTIAKEKGLILQSFFDFDQVPIIVNADQIRLSQVIINFISNSVKYTNKGKVFLHVTMANSTDEDFPFHENFQQIEIGNDNQKVSGTKLQFLKIICEDTGIGIPEEEIEHLCQPFHTVANSSRSTPENNYNYSFIMGGGQHSFNDRHGIGLNVAKNFIQLMKGKLLIDSEINKGTTITLFIPIVAKCGSQEEASSTPKIYHTSIFSKIKEVQQIGASLRVAILEDDPVYSSILTKLCNQILKPQLVSHIEKCNVVEFLTTLLETSTTDNNNTLIMYNHIDYKDVIEQRFSSSEKPNNKFIPIFKRGDKIPTTTKPIILPSRVESIVKSIHHCLYDNKPTSPTNHSLDNILTTKTTPPKTNSIFLNIPSQKMLVVDDNAINRKILKKALNLMGFSADTASDGAEALEIIKKHPNDYEFIFMDLIMPNMGGKESCELMRKAGCESRIVAVTANMWESSQSLMQSGFTSVLRKPFTIDDIRQMVIP